MKPQDLDSDELTCDAVQVLVADGMNRRGVVGVTGGPVEMVGIIVEIGGQSAVSRLRVVGVIAGDAVGTVGIVVEVGNQLAFKKVV